MNIACALWFSMFGLLLPRLLQLLLLLLRLLCLLTPKLTCMVSLNVRHSKPRVNFVDTTVRFRVSAHTSKCSCTLSNLQSQIHQIHLFKFICSNLNSLIVFFSVCLMQIGRTWLKRYVYYLCPIIMNWLLLLYQVLAIGLLPYAQKYGLRMHRECRERFPATAVSDLDMHHGTCVTHVPWCDARAVMHSEIAN